MTKRFQYLIKKKRFSDRSNGPKGSGYRDKKCDQKGCFNCKEIWSLHSWHVVIWCFQWVLMRFSWVFSIFRHLKAEKGRKQVDHKRQNWAMILRQLEVILFDKNRAMISSNRATILRSVWLNVEVTAKSGHDFLTSRHDFYVTYLKSLIYIHVFEPGVRNFEEKKVFLEL